MANLRCVLTAPPPPAQATTSVSTIASPSPLLIASPMARPAPFSGVAEECNGFLLQCSLYMENQTHLYTTERSKVSFLISLLSSKALQWAETIWAQAGNITQSFDNFVSHFREVFGLGVDRYVFFRADTDYYRSSRPITDILNRYTCLV